jgi:hypothetical protein
MLCPCGEGRSPPNQNMHWDHGLLINYDYLFLYAKAMKPLREISLRNAEEHENDLPVEETAQADNDWLLHHTVSIFIQSK